MVEYKYLDMVGINSSETRIHIKNRAIFDMIKHKLYELQDRKLCFKIYQGDEIFFADVLNTAIPEIIEEYEWNMESAAGEQIAEQHGMEI